MKRGTHITPLSLLLAKVDAVADGAAATDTIPTGFASVDRMLGGGARRGDLIALGGDVGSGKSALALAIAMRATQSEPRRDVVLLSGEMSPERIMERALAIEGRVAVDDLRGGASDDATRAKVGAAAMRIRDFMPAIDRLPDDGVQGIAELVDRRWTARGTLGMVDGGGAGGGGGGGGEAARRFPRGGGEVALLVIDSLQALATGSRDRDQELATAVRMLKTLALDLNIAILTTVQLTPLSTRAERRPQLDDFGALGAVKHHADVVLGLFREEMYEGAREIAGATELLVCKNRNGNIGYVDLYFYSKWMRFEDMLDPDR